MELTIKDTASCFALFFCFCFFFDSKYLKKKEIWELKSTIAEVKKKKPLEKSNAEKHPRFEATYECKHPRT